MYCRKCGSKMGDSERFCTRCGAKVEIDDINQQAPPMFMYNDINKSVESGISDGELIRAYIGSKENKMYYKTISKSIFNVWAYLFGVLYYAYRKLYIEAIIILIVNLIIVYVLKLNYLMAFFNILYSAIFYTVYEKHIERKIDKIKKKYPNATKDELIKKCSKKGGVNILWPLLIIIVLFGGSFIKQVIVGSNNTKLVGIWDCQGANNERLLIEFNTDNNFTYSGYYNPDNNYIKGTYRIYQATSDTYLLFLMSNESVDDGIKSNKINYSFDTISINEDNLKLGESYTCKRSTSLY